MVTSPDFQIMNQKLKRGHSWNPQIHPKGFKEPPLLSGSTAYQTAMSLISHSLLLTELYTRYAVVQILASAE